MSTSATRGASGNEHPLVKGTMVTARQMVPVSLTCLCILFAFSATAATESDSNVKVPSGSYQLTCVVLDTRGNNLPAICQAYENGKLTCNRNQVGPPDTYLDAFGDGAPGLGKRSGPLVRMQGDWLTTELHDPHRCVADISKLIGANLQVWSRAESGTEIDLTLPASTAYVRTAAQHRSWFIWKETGVKS